MRVFLWLEERPCRRRRKINDKKRSWQAAASLPNIHHELLEARKQTLRAELSSSGRRLAARREGVCLCKVPRSASTQQHCQHPAARGACRGHCRTLCPGCWHCSARAPQSASSSMQCCSSAFLRQRCREDKKALTEHLVLLLLPDSP